MKQIIVPALFTVGCSLIPHQSPAPTSPAAPTADAPAAAAPTSEAPATATPTRTTRAECRGVADTRTDIDFNDLFMVDNDRTLAARSKLVLDSPRTDFVAPTHDVTENDISRYPKTTPAMVFEKGEPLLKIRCSTRYSTVDVMTTDGRYVKGVPMKVIDAAPTAFVFPTAPTLWEFDAHEAFVFASESDIAAVAGARDLQGLEKRCADRGLDKCSAAANKVKAGPYRPDQDQRADKACELAKTREVNRCMGKDRKRWDAAAKKLDDLRRARVTADFEKLRAKFTK